MSKQKVLFPFFHSSPPCTKDKHVRLKRAMSCLAPAYDDRLAYRHEFEPTGMKVQKTSWRALELTDILFFPADLCPSLFQTAGCVNTRQFSLFQGKWANVRERQCSHKTEWDTIRGKNCLEEKTSRFWLMNRWMNSEIFLNISNEH